MEKLLKIGIELLKIKCKNILIVWLAAGTYHAGNKALPGPNECSTIGKGTTTKKFIVVC